MPEFDATIAYRSIPGYSGYVVGNDGSVWSCRVPGGGLKRRKGVEVIGTRWHRMTPSSNGACIDYLIVGLRRVSGGKRTMKKVHRLVLEAFVGPRPEGMSCCHNDGDRRNNRLDNLRWDTRRANAADMIRHGTMPRGESHHLAVLTEDLVRTIRRLKTTRLSGNEIARQLNLNPKTVHMVLNGKTWKHVA